MTDGRRYREQLHKQSITEEMSAVGMREKPVHSIQGLKATDWKHFYFSKIS